jgi:hypothetical protein
VNAEQVGDRDVLIKLTVELAEAERAHYKKMFQGRESYYRDKYDRYERFLSFFRYADLSVRQFLWNHGFSYLRVIIFSLTFLILLSIYSLLRFADLDVKALVLLHLWGDIYYEAFKSFIDFPGFVQKYLSDVEIVITIILRYFSIGLIVNVFYMKNLKR